ncbi:hypothetical protein ASE04_09745 [Rhizobium sp. Root708]|uniref:hypothetical protein n=1 Tax=Rhizobium sp. Root708 TaxID=1736592 RepID=UPI0006F585DB|nr:hypothetical protein [Rhizobium sp. Root708]KRB51803.1 hypothetical protein ASE04_09745 [Rhizobium sp. Root708]
MKKPSNWKDIFREGMYASPELRTRKIHRDLLAYLVFRANPNIRLCWQTQLEMARIQGCSVRNTKDLLNYLAEIGAIYVVRIKDLPKHDQGVIHKLTPRKFIAHANAYFICEQWAEDQLCIIEDAAPVEGAMGISAEAKAEGRSKGNSSRKRYAPIELVPDIPPSDPSHDDWQILNSGAGLWGSPTAPSNMGSWGSPTTDMNLKDYPDETSAIPNAHDDRFGIPLSKAEQAETSQSSLSVRQSQTPRSGYGGGEAIATDPRPEALARPEGTEYDAAGARAIDRRVS